jgi:hypothetical protein
MTLDVPTPVTVSEYRRTLAALEEHQDRLKRMAARYPVFLRMPEQTYVFEEPAQVDEFLTELQRVVLVQWLTSLAEAISHVRRS